MLLSFDFFSTRSLHAEAAYFFLIISKEKKKENWGQFIIQRSLISLVVKLTNNLESLWVSFFLLFTLNQGRIKRCKISDNSIFITLFQYKLQLEPTFSLSLIRVFLFLLSFGWWKNSLRRARPILGANVLLPLSLGKARPNIVMISNFNYILKKKTYCRINLWCSITCIWSG